MFFLGGVGTNYGKKGGKYALCPPRKRFLVAEFDVDDDFAIEHDLIL